MNSIVDVIAEGELTSCQCFELVAKETVGHLAVVSEGGPMMLLVGVAVADMGVVVSLPDLMARDATCGQRVSLAVDHIDPVTKDGWSVVVSGVAFDLIDTVDSAFRAMACRLLASQADKERCYPALVIPTRISGRRFTRPSGPFGGDTRAGLLVWDDF